jgi:hypothetical protein
MSILIDENTRVVVQGATKRALISAFAWNTERASLPE